MDKRKSPRIRMPQLVIAKSPGLLNMQYKVRELSMELGIPDSTLRDWLRLGAPHSRDNRRHIWINGQEFAQWVESFKKPKRKGKLKHNQAFCFRCKKAVDLINPNIIPMQGKLIRITGSCPFCNTTINRGGRNAGVS